jgi:hypothetical protein
VTQDDFNDVAWRDFIYWAISQVSLMEQFCRETGKQMPSADPSVRRLERMIDEAVGRDDEGEWLVGFVDWATNTIWGAEYAPQAWRDQQPKQ